MAEQKSDSNFVFMQGQFFDAHQEGLLKMLARNNTPRASPQDADWLWKCVD